MKGATWLSIMAANCRSYLHPPQKGEEAGAECQRGGAGDSALLMQTERNSHPRLSAWTHGPPTGGEAPQVAQEGGAAPTGSPER